MKKGLTIVLMLALSVCMVFANGTKEATSTQSKDVQLRMMWWGGDSRHKPTLEALEKYHELNPNVTVEGEPNGWAGYYQKLVTQIAGGTSADLVQIDQPWLKDLCSKGEVFVDLTNNPNIDLSEFDAKFLDDYCSYNGKIYGIPTGTNVNTLIVDQSMLKAAGIDENVVFTWDNMITIGKQLHEFNPDWYLNGATPDHVKFWFEIYMAQLAGGVVDEDGNLMFTEEQAVEAFRYFKKWFDNDVVAPFAQTSLFYQKYQENPEWVNGNMCIAWTWTSSMYKDFGGRTGFSTTTLPVMEGAKNTGVLLRPSQIYVISASSKNPDEAVKLLSYMTCDKDAAAILGTARGVPSSKTALAVAAETGSITALIEKATNEGVAQAGDPQSSKQSNAQVSQVMQDIIDELGFGRMSPEEAGAKLVAHLNETLKSL